MSPQGKPTQNVALILSVSKWMVEKRLEPFPCLTARFYGYYDSCRGTLLRTGCESLSLSAVWRSRMEQGREWSRGERESETVLCSWQLPLSDIYYYNLRPLLQRQEAGTLTHCTHTPQRGSLCILIRYVSEASITLFCLYNHFKSA